MLTTKEIFGKGEGLDDKSLEFLSTAIEKNNLPGFDYYEFKRAVATLQSMNIDEATAHKSAFTTASTVGITKEKLLETAAYYRNLIEKEKTQFDLALENQNTQKIAKRQDEIARLKDQIERNKADVVRLQDEIAVYLQNIEKNEADLVSESEKLTKTKEAFEFTHQSMLNTIDKDIENIHKHI